MRTIAPIQENPTLGNERLLLYSRYSIPNKIVLIFIRYLLVDPRRDSWVTPNFLISRRKPAAC